MHGLRSVTGISIETLHFFDRYPAPISTTQPLTPRTAAPRRRGQVLWRCVLVVRELRRRHLLPRPLAQLFDVRRRDVLKRGRGLVRVVRQRYLLRTGEQRVLQVRRRDVVERERGRVHRVRCGQVVGLGRERVHQL